MGQSNPHGFAHRPTRPSSLFFYVMSCRESCLVCGKTNFLTDCIPVKDLSSPQQDRFFVVSIASFVCRPDSTACLACVPEDVHNQ